MLFNTYETVNSSTDVFVPFSSVSHVIECTEDSAERHGETCWIQFHSGKSIHVKSTFEDVTADLEEYFKILK